MVYEPLLDREIPAGWCIKDVDELCLVKGGKRLPKGETLVQHDTGKPYIKVADMRSTKYVLLNAEMEYVPTDIQHTISRYTVDGNDLIVSIVGTIGLVNIVHENLHGANLTENCVKLTQFRELSPEYLYEYLRSPMGQREIEMKTVGGVQGKLPLYNIKAIQVLCPKSEVLQRYAEVIRALDRKQNCSAQFIPKLTELKQILNSKMSIA